MVDTDYRGWKISAGYIGWYATHPDFDADWSDEDGGYVGNGKQVWATTVDILKEEVDCWEEENV